MDQPLVSIILPVYNAQNHLARCIGSILNQTYKNIELIILNDGSKDHSLPVCEEFRARDSRIVQLRKVAMETGDDRFIEGVRIIEEAYQPEVSKQFIRAEIKNENGMWKPIPLGMTES